MTVVCTPSADVGSGGGTEVGLTVGGVQPV